MNASSSVHIRDEKNITVSNIRTSHNKADQDQWTRMEDACNDDELATLAAMEKLGKRHTSLNQNRAECEENNDSDNSIEIDIKIKACGEELYISKIRPLLAEAGLLLPAEEVKNNQNKKAAAVSTVLKKADQIKMENTFNQLKSEIGKLLSSFHYKVDEKMNYANGLKSNIIELRLVTLLYMFRFIMQKCCGWSAKQFSINQSLGKSQHKQNQSKTSAAQPADIFKQQINQTDEKRAFKLLLTLRLAIEELGSDHSASSSSSSLNPQFSNISNPTQKIGVSPTLLQDLERAHVQLKQSFSYNERKMFANHPELADRTKYYPVLPMFSIRPHKHQIELMDLVQTCPEYLCLYRPNFGGGKTTAVIGICKYLENLRGHDLNPLIPKHVIYCCAVEPVRETVGKMAFNKSVPFGIATGDKDWVANNWSTVKHRAQAGRSKDDVRILTICDPESALREIMKLNHNNQQYILFLDEPTVDADLKDSPITKLYVELLAVAPKRTILASASLPKEEHLQRLIGLFRNRFPQIAVHSISSPDIKIGCKVSNYNTGELISPHYGCKNVMELDRVIRKYEENQFLARLCTPEVLYLLDEKIQSDGAASSDLSNNSEVLSTLDSEFQKASDMTHNTIKRVLVSRLKWVRKHCSDAQIEKICSVKCSNVDKIDLTKLGTTEAHKFMGQTLMVCSDPVEAALYCFSECFVQSESKQPNQTSFESFDSSLILQAACAKPLVESYLEKREIHAKELAKRIHTISTKSGQQSKREGVVSKMDRERQTSELKQNTSGVQQPELEFPEWRQINSKKHVEKYVNSQRSTPTIRLEDTRRLLCLEQECPEMLTTNIPDFALWLLLHGVGIYTQIENTKFTFSNRYFDYVLQLASKGRLSFLITDDSICYGTSYPFNNLIVFGKVMNRHSISTLMQLFARSGRVGQSWVSNVYIDDETALRILEFIRQDDADFIPLEAKHIEEEIESFLATRSAGVN